MIGGRSEEKKEKNLIFSSFLSYVNIIFEELKCKNFYYILFAMYLCF